MSIADFIVENGYGPWFEDPYYSSSRSMDVEDDGRPNPEKNQEWMTLVENPAFAAGTNSKSSKENEIVTAVQDETIQITTHDGHQHKGLRTVNGEAMKEMHPGALAPRWVLECKNPIRVKELHSPASSSLLSYQRRLLCALHGRFVCIDGWGPTLRSSNGIPRASYRYGWRYWDNNGNVYEDSLLKWCEGTDWTLSNHHFDSCGMYEVPGNFNPRGMRCIWMQDPAGNPMDYGGVLSACPHYTNLRDFWGCLWRWTFVGSTGDSDWDEGMEQLTKSARVMHRVDKWPLQQAALHKMAGDKGWTKIDCRQPTVAAYKRNDGAHLHFHLNSGTVVTIDNNQTMKRLFHQNMTNVSELFAISNNNQAGGESTGNGTRKRKDAPSPIHRTCSLCGASKTNHDFSKNQRRKGSGATCKLCIDERRKV